jgi:hypothetical protein
MDLLHSKLIEILRGVKKEEWQRLTLFLPFALKDDTASVAAADVIALLNCLKPYAPAFEDNALNDPQFLEKHFQHKSFTKAKLSKILSALTKVLEKFFVYQYVVQDEWGFKSHLAEAYDNRLLINRLHLLTDTLNTLPSTFDPQDLLKWYKVKTLICKIETLKNVRKSDVNLFSLTNALDTFYLISRLDHLLVMASQALFVNYTEKAVLIQTAEALAELSQIVGLSDNSILQLYFLGLNLVLKNEGYDQYAQALDATQTVLHFEQRQRLRSIQRNTLSTRYNKGEVELAIPYFTMLREHLEKGYTLYEGKILMSTFLNLVTMGLRVKEFDWVEMFIAEYSQKLVGTDESAEITALQKANLSFHRGNLTQALAHLPNHKFKDYAYDMALRRLDIKIHFELEDPVLDAKLNAFKNYLFESHRRSMPTDKFEPNNKFVNMVKRMMDIKIYPQKAEKLKQQILEDRSHADRDWLLEKLERI